MKKLEKILINNNNKKKNCKQEKAIFSLAEKAE